MQHLDKNKSETLIKTIGTVTRKLRKEKEPSLNMFAYENGLQSSLVSRVENAKNEPAFLSIWCISEALGIKMSDLMKYVEEELPEDWKLLEE